jgi:hypothetical protein
MGCFSSAEQYCSNRKFIMEMVLAYDSFKFADKKNFPKCASFVFVFTKSYMPLLEIVTHDCAAELNDTAWL